MLNVAISETPNDIYGAGSVYPVGHCYRWCFEVEGYTPFGFASIWLDWQDGDGLSDGDTFELCGVTFTSDSTSTAISGGCIDFSSSSGFTNVEKLCAAINNHPELADKIECFAGTQTAYIFWKTKDVFADATEVPWVPFESVGPQLSFVGLGTETDIPKGFELVYRLECSVLQGSERVTKPICGWEHLPPIYDANCDMKPFCVDICKDDLAKKLGTAFPDCASTEGVELDEGNYFVFTMSFGYVQQKADGCGNEFKSIQKIPLTTFSNQVYNPNCGDIVDFLDTTFIDPTNPILTEFRTSKPSGCSICLDDCDWLWLFYTEAIANGTGGLVEYCLTYKDGTTDKQYLTIDPMFGAIVIPSGPENILLAIDDEVDFTQICSYTVQVILDGYGPYSEIYEYKIDHNKCCTYPVYFLDPKGGRTLLDLECVESLDCETTMDEVCINTACNASYDDILLGSKSNYDSKQIRSITLRTRKYSRKENKRELYMAFKASQEKYILVDGKWKRMLSGAFSTRIFQKDSLVYLETTLIDAIEYKAL